MQVYLLRHGVAEDIQAGKTDADRELTADGRRKLRDILRCAARADVKPTLILTSPLVRSLQTSEVARGIFNYRGEILRTNALLPASRVEQVWDEMRVHRDQSQLLLVGHDPLFSMLTGHLLGAPDLRLDFKKGALLRVDFEAFGPHPSGLLRWFLVAKLAAPAPLNSARTSRP